MSYRCKFQPLMQKIGVISLRKLLSISVHLASEACEIIHKFAVNKNVKKYTKDIDDLVTQADFKIQSLLIKGIRTRFPTLRIVGEEQMEYEGLIDYNYDVLDLPIIPQQVKISRECSQEQLCVWIDPIDCTKGFVLEKFHDCTVLIGVDCNKYAELGVVGIPYKLVDGQSVYDPSVLIGSVAEQIAYEYFPRSGKWQQLSKLEPSKQITVTTSINRQNQIQNYLISQLGASQIRVGGSGRKIAMVIKENVSLAAYTQTGTMKWDSCAGEAVIKALGGYLTDCKGHTLEYNYDKPKQKNQYGFICSMDQQLLEKSVEICKSYKDLQSSL